MPEHQFLDARYLAFLTATKRVFDGFPALAGLRYALFKTLLVQRRGLRPDARVKSMVRSLTRRRRTPVHGSRADVLFLVETRRDVVSGALLPVHRELKRRGVRSRLLAAGGPATLDAVDTLRLAFRARTSAPAWARAAWVELWAVVPELRDRRLRSHFLALAATEQARSDELARVLESLTPRVVITAATNLPGGAQITRLACQDGIPTVLMQHGIPQAFYLPLMADDTLAWGQCSADVLRSLGESASRVHIIGSPRHDAMPGGRPGEGRAVLQRVLGLSDRPTLAFFSNGNDLYRNGDAPVQCARWLERVGKIFKARLNIVVRLHPNEDGSLYTDRQHLTLCKNEVDMATTLDGCDVAASLCSTVLYDALLFDRPVWQLHADGWPELADNWRQNLARRVASVAELGDLLERLVEGESEAPLEPGIVDRVFANHGRAAVCAADFIMRSVA